MDDPTVSMRQERATGPSPAPIQAWGPFQLLERVGEGGFGEVYRARDTKLDREVAVKLLRTNQGSDEDYSAVIREARLMARVRHPNVVSVYGVERYDGRVGLWSDFVRGKTLSDLLHAQGAFGARETALIGIELCRALSAMHSAGLLHRDIKTANAMREEGGRILLMDFGLSGESTGKPALAGTRGYMAPELYNGAPASVATDIYAMGVLLFCLACGRYPVDHDGTRRRLIDERPDLPESFARVIETALDPIPAKRFTSAGSMLSALSESLGVSHAEPVTIAAKPKLRRWLIAVAVLMAAGVAAYMTVGPGKKRVTGLISGENEDYIQAMALLQREDRRENIDKAITLFEKNIAANPQSALAHSGLASANLLKYKTTKDASFVDKARLEAERALEIDNNLAIVHVVAGSVYVNINKYDLAAREIQFGIKLDATSAEAQAALAALYDAQGRPNDVVPAYQKAIDLGPDDWRWPNRLGSYFLSKGNNAGAVEQYRRVVALVPDNIFGFTNLGIAYRRQERFSDAEAALQQALTLNPQYASALSSLGTVFMMESKFDAAAEQYRRAVALLPQSYQMHANLAAAYQWSSGIRGKATEEYLSAIALAEKARKDQPRSPGLLADLGSYYAAVGKADQSLPLLRQAVALSPDNPSVLDRAGEGFEIIGHRKEALDAILKAMDLGFSQRYIELSPDLLSLRKDPKFLAHASKLR